MLKQIPMHTLLLVYTDPYGVQYTVCSLFETDVRCVWIIERLVTLRLDLIFIIASVFLKSIFKQLHGHCNGSRDTGLLKIARWHLVQVWVPPVSWIYLVYNQTKGLCNFPKCLETWKLHDRQFISTLMRSNLIFLI